GGRVRRGGRKEMESGVQESRVCPGKTTSDARALRRPLQALAMNLLCDHMLGSLARWLRFMGYDTAYPEPGPDRTLIARVRSEDRILLTRDKELAARATGAVRMRSDILDDQMREVAAALPLRLVGPLSRCSCCPETLASPS